MATKSGARVAAMLLLLCTTALPAWADYWDGNRKWSDYFHWNVFYRNETMFKQTPREFRFKGEFIPCPLNGEDSPIYADNFLRVENSSTFNISAGKSFNLQDGSFYWEFQVDPLVLIDYNDEYYDDYYLKRIRSKYSFDAEIYVVTADDVMHKIATWEKHGINGDGKDYDYYGQSPHDGDRVQLLSVQSEITDTQYGVLYISDIEKFNNDGVMFLRYIPSMRAIQEGVKCFVVKEYVSESTNMDDYSQTIEIGWIQLEKDIQCPTFNDSNPMPKFSSVAWKTDGSLRGVATDVPDKRSDNNYTQNYEVTMYYYKGDKQSRTTTYGTSGSNVSITGKSGGKMDMEWISRLGGSDAGHAEYAYTMPIYLKYRGVGKINTSSLSNKFPGKTLSEP